MTISALPGLIIARLRAEVPGFANRVAGTAEEAKASEQVDFPLPHAFVMPGGLEPIEAQLSGLDQEVSIRFRVMIAVSNASDERGQTGGAALLGLAAATMQALIGWEPGAGYSAVLSEGLEDSFESNRATLWGSLTFRTSAMASDL